MVSAKPQAPENWQEVWSKIEVMRKKQPAPVDSMGCSVLADNTLDPKVFRYQVLISLMLSSQTKDEMTSAAMKNLQKHGLTVENILKTPETEIDQLIKQVGFHTKKASYIKKTTQILHDKYSDDIPDNIDALMELPGIGPKMGYLALLVAFNKVAGIGVDVHVHRISNRLGWANTAKKAQNILVLHYKHGYQ